MKLEIEVPNWGDSRWNLIEAASQTSMPWEDVRVLLDRCKAARDAALRPIRVGDRVMIMNDPGSMGEVLAVDGDQAWVKSHFDLRSTWNRSALRRVTGGEA